MISLLPSAEGKPANDLLDKAGVHVVPTTWHLVWNSLRVSCWVLDVGLSVCSLVCSFVSWDYCWI